MVNYLSEGIADLYIKKRIVLPNEKEVYKFGISLILNDIITFSLILICSAIFVKFRYGAEFLLTFCLTRIFTGGYHARKAYLCRICMFAVAFLAIFLASQKVFISHIVLLSVLALSLIVAMPFVPVKHPNKELTDKLIKRGKAGTALMYIIGSAISILCFLYVSTIDAFVIALSLSAVSVLVIIGKFTNERSETK